MRSVFIVNPQAGKKGKAQILIQRINEFFKGSDEEYTIYTTTPDDTGERFARQEAEKGDEVRVFACGGDGTVYNVLNGVMGFENASLGVIPCGTANDFIKYFGQDAFDCFTDVSSQLNGEVYRFDAIKAGGRYGLNQCSIGLDADVCVHKGRFSRLPLISGQTAYVMSLFYCFFKSIRNKLTVRIDDGEPRTGDYLFAVAANGRYYGGGFKSAPEALADDGFMDCMTVDSVSRLKIISLLRRYSRGEHTSLSICSLKKGKKMTVIADKPTAVNMDGEIFFEKEVTFEIVPGAVRFIIPQGCGGKFSFNQENFFKKEECFAGAV